MAEVDHAAAEVRNRERLLNRGRVLEALTLAWNVAGVVLLVSAAIKARSVALAGFGLDSAVEIAASAVVLYELGGVDEARQRRVLRWIGIAFIVLAAYLTLQSLVLLALGVHPHHSPIGITWTALTAVVMFALAASKRRTGLQLESQILVTESRVTFVDGLLAATVLAGLVANAALGWWWADPVSAFVIVGYSVRESLEALRLSRAVPESSCSGICGSCTGSCAALAATPQEGTP